MESKGLFDIVHGNAVLELSVKEYLDSLRQPEANSSRIIGARKNLLRSQRIKIQTDMSMQCSTNPEQILCSQPSGLSEASIKSTSSSNDPNFHHVVCR